MSDAGNSVPVGEGGIDAAVDDVGSIDGHIDDNTEGVSGATERVADTNPTDDHDGVDAPRSKLSPLWWGGDRPEAMARLLGLATAFVVVVAGTSPTGAPPGDLILLNFAAAFAIWAGRSAPWQAVAAAGALATTIALFSGAGPVGVVGGLLTVALALARAMGRGPDALAYVSVAALVVSTGGLGNVAVFGLSTVIGCGLVAVVMVLGLRQRGGHDAALARRVVAGSVAFAAAATIVAAGFAWWARSDLTAAQGSIDNGIAEASDADLGAAGESLRQANGRFNSAHRKLSNPLVWPARLVPGVSQNIAAASDAAGAAGDFTGALTDTIDLATGDSGVQISDGAIDIGALGRLVDAAAGLPAEVDRLADRTRAAESPWLLPPLANGLESVSTTAETQRPVVQRYADITQLLPAMLGAEGERHYFVMFTTPAEARGQGGFMGNFAELSVTDGKIEMSEFGRVNDLEQAMKEDLRLVDAPDDWLERYGPYGFVSEDDGTVEHDAWAIINLSAHFPSTAAVVAEMYASSGGPPIDAVFSMDLYGLEALVGLVGPIEVADGSTLTGDNTAEFLLFDQYLVDPDQGAARVDMLSSIANEVVDRLLRDDPPSPVSLAQALAPLGRERRLLAWSPNAEEEALFEEIGVSGAVLDPHARDTDDGSAFQVVVNNGNGSKIDSFLRRKITVEDNAVTVQLRNTAPSSGLSEYIIGNAGELGTPLGTNLTNFTVYSTHPLSNFTLDGKPVEPPDGTEAGYYTYDMRFPIYSGETVTVAFDTAEPDATNILQPLARTVDDWPG